MACHFQATPNDRHHRTTCEWVSDASMLWLSLLDGVSPRQDDDELRERARLGLDLDPAAVLLDDDIVTHRQTEPGAFAGRLGREERVEHLVPYLGRDADAVVADADFNLVAAIVRDRT